MNKNHRRVFRILQPDKKPQRNFRILQPKNKRGDLPVTILVIGVVLICGLALFSFLASGIKTGQSLLGVSQIEEMNSKIDEYYFYKKMEISDQEIEKILEIENGAMFIEKTPSNIFKKEKFLFSVKYNIP